MLSENGCHYHVITNIDVFCVETLILVFEFGVLSWQMFLIHALIGLDWKYQNNHKIHIVSQVFNSLRPSDAYMRR